MRLKYTFESVELGDEIVMVPVGVNSDVFQGVLKLNAEAKEIIDFLKEDVREEDIISRLILKYENNPKELNDYVHRLINELRDYDLIKE